MDCESALAAAAALTLAPVTSGLPTPSLNIAVPEPSTAFEIAAPEALARLMAVVAAVGGDNGCGNNDMGVAVPAHAAPAAPAATRAAFKAVDPSPSSLAVTDIDAAPLVAPVPTVGRTAAAPDPTVGMTAAAAGAPDPAARTSCTSPARLLGL